MRCRFSSFNENKRMATMPNSLWLKPTLVHSSSWLQWIVTLRNMSQYIYLLFCWGTLRLIVIKICISLYSSMNKYKVDTSFTIPIPFLCFLFYTQPSRPCWTDILMLLHLYKETAFHCLTLIEDLQIFMEYRSSIPNLLRVIF